MQDILLPLGWAIGIVVVGSLAIGKALDLLIVWRLRNAHQFALELDRSEIMLGVGIIVGIERRVGAHLRDECIKEGSGKARTPGVATTRPPRSISATNCRRRHRFAGVFSPVR